MILSTTCLRVFQFNHSISGFTWRIQQNRPNLSMAYAHFVWAIGIGYIMQCVYAEFECFHINKCLFKYYKWNEHIRSSTHRARQRTCVLHVQRYTSAELLEVDWKSTVMRKREREREQGRLCACLSVSETKKESHVVGVAKCSGVKCDSCVKSSIETSIGVVPLALVAPFHSSKTVL